MKTYTILLLLSNVFCHSHAQTNSEIRLMKSVVISADNHHKHSEFAKNNSNEIQYLFSGFFLFYKTFISSQDGQSCSFTPSCSEYGILSVKKHGAVIGIAATFDRLMRCHGLAPELYERDVKTALLVDFP